VIPHPLKNFEITPHLALEAMVHSVASERTVGLNAEAARCVG
jgi:hypothetical protein